MIVTFVVDLKDRFAMVRSSIHSRSITAASERRFID